MIYRASCGCAYETRSGELMRPCPEHQPYAGSAFGAAEVLARIESELGWPA